MGSRVFFILVPLYFSNVVRLKEKTPGKYVFEFVLHELNRFNRKMDVEIMCFLTCAFFRKNKKGKV